MKKYLLTLIALAFFPVIALAETATVTINGMMCDSCAESITTYLKRSREVQSVEVNLKKGIAQVVFNPGKTLTDEVLQRIIADAGYKASEVKRTA